MVFYKSFFSKALIISLVLVFVTSLEAQSIFFPATGLYNGYLNQTNIVECENSGSKAVSPRMTLYSLNGNAIVTLPMRIEANGSQHIILNDLIDIKDKYGIYKIEISEEEELVSSFIACRTAFYRPANSKSKKLFDFAYSIPIKNPDSGEQFGAFNSHNPSNSTEPTFNWLSLVNLGKTPFSAQIFLYNQRGEQISVQSVDNILPNSRLDFPLGHNQGQITGTYRVVPTDLSSKYQAFIVRYGISNNQFKFAFPLQSIKGSCSGNLIPLSTAGSLNTLNWLEVANLNGFSIPVTITIRSRNGEVLSNSRIGLAAYSQHHIFINSIIDPQQTNSAFGTAEILCDDPSDKILAQSVYYGRGSRSDLEWAYASQDLGFSGIKKGDTLINPINTYLGMANWVKLSNSSNSSIIDFNVFGNGGDSLAQGETALATKSGADIGVHEIIPDDTIGLTNFSSKTDNSNFSGEILRVVPDAGGNVGTIMQIPGIIKRRGLVNRESIDDFVTSGFIGESQSLSQYRDRLTYEEASHLLTRTNFGASYNQIKQAQEDGLELTVSKILELSFDANIENEAAKHLDNDYALNSSIININGVQKYWLYHMLNGHSPFRERMAFIWHDLFAASCSVVSDDRIINSCYMMLQTFRNNALGNYRTIAQSMTRDYVMLRWLNGNVNRKGNPDENYAREFWELFSLGEASKHKGRNNLYASADIKEAARAFTGWTTPIPPSQTSSLAPLFVSSRFDDGTKKIFVGTPYEVSGTFNDLDIVEKTLARPETAEWVVKRLFTALAHDNPSPSVVNQLSAILISNNYEVKPVVKKILLSEAIFSRESSRSRVKDPLTFGVGFIRSTGIPADVNRVFGRVNNNAMGLQPLFPPSVNGWPINKYKESFLSQFFLGWSLNYANFIRGALREASSDFPSFSYSKLIPFSTSTYEEKIKSAEKLVDYWSFVLGVNLNQNQRQILINYMHSRRNNDGTTSFIYFNPDDLSLVRNKLIGLLWILTQHEDYKTF